MAVGLMRTTAGIGSVSTRPLSSSPLHVCGNLVMQMELGYLTRLFDELFFLPRQGYVNVQVIIDSQPLTVAVLAAFLYGEVLGPKSIVAMAFGIFGLILIEVGR